MKLIKRIILLGILLISHNTFSQIAREVHVDNDPLDWSNPWNIAMCAVVPVLLVIGGLYIRNKAKK